jgi:hypothetical protein
MTDALDLWRVFHKISAGCLARVLDSSSHHICSVLENYLVQDTVLIEFQMAVESAAMQASLSSNVSCTKSPNANNDSNAMKDP